MTIAQNTVLPMVPYDGANKTGLIGLIPLPVKKSPCVWKLSWALSLRRNSSCIHSAAAASSSGSDSISMRCTSMWPVTPRPCNKLPTVGATLSFLSNANWMSKMAGHLFFKYGRLAVNPFVRGIKWCLSTVMPRSCANFTDASCFVSVKRVPSAFSNSYATKSGIKWKRNVLNMLLVWFVAYVNVCSSLPKLVLDNRKSHWFVVQWFPCPCRMIAPKIQTRRISMTSQQLGCIE